MEDQSTPKEMYFLFIGKVFGDFEEGPMGVPTACKLITSDMAGHLPCLLKSDFLIATPPRKRDGYTALSDTSISGPLFLQQATSRNVKFEEGEKKTA